MKIILFGAGGTVRGAVKMMIRPEYEVVSIVDNAAAKWGTELLGVRVRDAESAMHKYPDAYWVASVMTHEPAVEIREQLKKMGVKTMPLWQVIDACHGLPPASADGIMRQLVADDESFLELLDQEEFRANPDYDRQRHPSDIKDIYFPGFIKHRDDEHFIDLGACDGDTVAEFRKRWSSYSRITALEPDPSNYRKLANSCLDDLRHHTFQVAVGDLNTKLSFSATGDYSSHIAEREYVTPETFTIVDCVRLDDFSFDVPPTYIKMDIEGAELQALWGARRILKEHMPVLAVCAYHTQRSPLGDTTFDSRHSARLPAVFPALRRGRLGNSLVCRATGAREMIHCVRPEAE